ncbi:MAG: response regulator [Desulfobacterota bacterium]|nr:response regulator [Thermodesulfobacteriota bacterium]
MAKILIAEDEKNVRELFARAIENIGHVAIQSPDGSLAWEILQANPDIRLIVCDIAMPNLDGRQLIQRIRARPEFASLPIIIVSGVIRARDIASLLEQGATCFLPKPVNLQELRETISTYLSKAA